jgi:hypothetical protein
MTPDNAGLLSCPFDAGVAKHRYREVPFSKWRHYVSCDACGAEGESCASKNDAIAAWNNRTPPPMRRGLFIQMAVPFLAMEVHGA